MPSPILARADALMQRRRLGTEADDVPVLTDAVDLGIPDNDDDVPVLLDIEPTKAFAPLAEPGLQEEHGALPATPNPSEEPALSAFAESGNTASTTSPADTTAENIAREIARRVEERLVAELPMIIQAAVRDYLAEQHPTDALRTGSAG